MTFLENIDKAKLQKILLITISVLALAALTILLVIIAMSIKPTGLSTNKIEFEDYVLKEKDVNMGSLILADSSHAFSASADLSATMSNCQEYRNQNRGDLVKGPYYSMNDVQLSLISIGAAHELLTAAENAIKNDDLLIKYAYNGNDGSTDEYKTGMLMLLTDYDEEKLPEAYASWIDSNSAKYGFIESFEDAYRYVGIPHAEYMTQNKLSLADYIDYLKDNTSYDKTLSVNGGEYSVYYISAKAGDTIKVPAEAEGTYTISGTNEGGVIVTVKH